MLVQMINTMKQVKKMVKAIEEMEGGREINLGFSSILRRTDHDFDDKIKNINDNLRNAVAARAFFIDSDDMI